MIVVRVEVGVKRNSFVTMGLAQWPDICQRGISGMKTYVFRVVVEPDEERWLAYSPVLKDRGGATWGATREEALENIRQVVQMTVDSMIEHGETLPEDPSTDVQVFVDPQVAINV